MHSNLEIIIGTYEEFLLGYLLKRQENNNKPLTQSFADKSHSGPIKCIATKGRWIATGATDDRIFIYDMRARKQAQILLCHDNSINCLDFTPDETHLLSGGNDGNLIATRVESWTAEANWTKAHGGVPVTHVACHPSGKLALSLGNDLILRTWNLIKGRVAYKKNLKSRNSLGYIADCLSWSICGNYFTVTGQNIIEIWSIKKADVVHSVKLSSKPVCVAWVSENECLIGLENGEIKWTDIDGALKMNIVIKAHNTRVKAMYFYNGILATASSSGEIKIWEINLIEKELKEITVTDIGCRPTCITILDLEQFGQDYILNKNSMPIKDDLKITKKVTQKERGKVTIEYENDDEAAIVDRHGKGDNDNDVDDENDDDDDDSEENHDGDSTEDNPIDDSDNNDNDENEARHDDPDDSDDKEEEDDADGDCGSEDEDEDEDENEEEEDDNNYDDDGDGDGEKDFEVEETDDDAATEDIEDDDEVAAADKSLQKRKIEHNVKISNKKTKTK